MTSLAFGPVFKKKKEDVIHLCWQTNILANYFAGLNWLWRNVNGQKSFAPGVYAKYPYLFGFEKEEDDSDSDWADIFDK